MTIHVTIILFRECTSPKKITCLSDFTSGSGSPCASHQCSSCHPLSQRPEEGAKRGPRHTDSPHRNRPFGVSGTKRRASCGTRRRFDGAKSQELRRPTARERLIRHENGGRRKGEGIANTGSKPGVWGTAGFHSTGVSGSFLVGSSQSSESSHLLLEMVHLSFSTHKASHESAN